MEMGHFPLSFFTARYIHKEAPDNRQNPIFQCFLHIYLQFYNTRLAPM